MRSQFDKITYFQWECTFFNINVFFAKKQVWIAWLQNKSIVMMKMWMHEKRTVGWSVNSLYWSVIFLNAKRVMKAAKFWKISKRKFLEYRILTFSMIILWLWIWLINNKEIAFIIFLRSSVDVLNCFLKTAWPLSLRDVTVVSKCNTLLMKHLTKRVLKSRM